MTTKEFSTLLQNKLTSEYGVDLSVASNQQIYRALALICRQMMSDNYKKFQSKVIGTGSKQVYYLCMEFLMGRSLKVSLLNLGLDEVCKAALAAADINVDTIYEEEPDAGLGNGGLGRLAACYLDGMATTCIGGTGYSILYEYGIFKQKIVDGWQQGARRQLAARRPGLAQEPPRAGHRGPLRRRDPRELGPRLPLCAAPELQQRHGGPLRYVRAGLRRPRRGKAAPVAGQGPRL